MSLADHVRTLARGQGRARSLTRLEAEDAMREILSGQAEPEAVGAILMLMRMKGETADEIAGFAHAGQAALQAFDGVDLDWPSYAAGRTRGQPYFLAAARLVAQSGQRVLLHGWNGQDPKVRAGLSEVGIRRADSMDAASRLLDQDRIAYLPLEVLHPPLLRLLRLREVLGLRSCVNTVCRMLNPGRADASVQGVFHPSYRLLQADAAARLGWKNLSVIKGGGGEFERTPAKDVLSFGLRDSAAWSRTFSAECAETRRPDIAEEPRLADLWEGREASEFATETVLGTAALALETLGIAAPAETAAALWAGRTLSRAA
ncbi:MAG: glycosyl transferase family protein [Pseudomonadota bacterium]